MRKNLNKVLAAGIVLSSFTTPVMQVYASEMKVTVIDSSEFTQSNQANKPILSLESAIESAIENSDTLKLYDKKIEYQESINKESEKLDDLPQVEANKDGSFDFDDMDDDDQEYNEDTRDLNMKILKQKREFEEDKLIKKVTDSYNSLIYSEVQILNLQKQYDMQIRKLNDAKLMNKLSVNTPLNVQELDIAIQTLGNNISTLKDNLKNAQYSFKVLTDKDLNDYSLDKGIGYDSFKIDGDINEYFDDIIDDYLLYNKEMIKLNNDHLDDNKVKNPGKFDDDEPKLSDFSDDIDAETGEVIKTAKQKYQAKCAEYVSELTEYTKSVGDRIKYLQSRMSAEESETNLNEQKKNLKDALKSYYSLLNSKELDINVLKQKIDVSNQKLEIAKTKYNLKLITNADYCNCEIEKDNLELQLRQAVTEYKQTKEKIEKPWVGISEMKN